MSNEKKVTIRLPLSRSAKEDVFVGVNGRSWLIKRGETVSIPLCAAKVLEQREKMLTRALEYENRASGALAELEGA